MTTKVTSTIELTKDARGNAILDLNIRAEVPGGVAAGYALPGEMLCVELNEDRLSEIMIALALELDEGLTTKEQREQALGKIAKEHFGIDLNDIMDLAGTLLEIDVDEDVEAVEEFDACDCIGCILDRTLKDLEDA